MIELRNAFNEAVANLANWRNKYPTKVYPHKIVINMMYRAYSTRFVYQAFANDEMPEFDDFDDATQYVLRFFRQAELTEVHPYLEDWMKYQPNEEVGTINTTRYEALATKAENDKKFQEELEFSYIFEVLNDKSVLYYIALRLSGESEVDAIAKMTDFVIAPLQYADYTIIKQVFQQLLVGRYMSINYRPLPQHF